MAYSTVRQQCAMDNSCKQAGVFKCQGCGNAYCSNHSADHRRKLGQELDGIISEHDHLKNIFTQHTSNLNLDSLIKQIDDWKRESIEKIQRKANELHEQLLQSTATHITELSNRLEPVSGQLNKGREFDDFVEQDLSLWKETLARIKTDLISPLNFVVTQHDGNPLVRNVSIVVIMKTVNERFDRVFNNQARIVEDGAVVIRDGSDGWTEIRGKNEYSSGCHQIRLRIESAIGANMFLGINSKETVLQASSCFSKSAYLWRGNNDVYLNGSCQTNACNPCVEMKTNDIITLMFDCDNKKISMINERTKTTHELTINVNDCSFPWQLHVNMYNVGESIRILPS